jgi:hypothetical protein
MKRGGIDVKKCSSHSVRSAAVSKASAKFVSVDKVLKVAGWSNAKTFAKKVTHNLLSGGYAKSSIQCCDQLGLFCFNNPSKNIVYE